MDEQRLILSVFPGIDLFGMAFEQEGFCVVRGPDVLWGGDIHRFHPPAGKFDGVIGGPPCQLWARTSNFHSGNPINLIPEFERIVRMAAPAWFLMENVPGAPIPDVEGYVTRDTRVRDVHVGGDTTRLRRFSLGTPNGASLDIIPSLLHQTNPHPTVIAGGSAKKEDGSRYRNGKNYGAKTSWAFEQGKVLQGLPKDFDLPPFTVRGKVAAIGNGVPLAMGRAVAQAVKRAMYVQGA